VDRATRDRLIAEHPSSAEVLKPFLRGRDIKRWRCEPKDLWLIFVPWHFPLHDDPSITGASNMAECEFAKRYPAIFAHLLQFKSKLEERNRAETGVRYEWYALQRWGAEYWREFEQPKIVFPDIASTPQFAWDDAQTYLVNTSYILLAPRWALGVLNSKAVLWFYCSISNAIRGGYLRFIAQYVSQIPIPPATPSQQKEITALVDNILAAKQADPSADVTALEREIDERVYRLYGLTPEEIKIVEEDAR
jgi:hypothetical protein